MLTSFVLPMIIACHAHAPSIAELQTASSSNLLKWAAEKNVILVAGGKRQAPGPIHDENHDYGLPANQHAGDGYPSDDPYNGSTDNNKDHPNKPY